MVQLTEIIVREITQRHKKRWHDCNYQCFSSNYKSNTRNGKYLRKINLYCKYKYKVKYYCLFQTRGSYKNKE